MKLGCWGTQMFLMYMHAQIAMASIMNPNLHALQHSKLTYNRGHMGDNLGAQNHPWTIIRSLGTS